MNGNLFVWAKYQHNSPIQLKGFPLDSVRLKRDRGFVSSKSTPVNSIVFPFVATLFLPYVDIDSITERIKSSIVSAQINESTTLTCRFAIVDTDIGQNKSADASKASAAAIVK
jgi:hypothetical protein